MTDDHPPVHEHRDHAINNYAGAALDVPAQAQAAPPLAAPVCIVIFDDPARNAAVGPAGVFLDEWPHQGPVPNADRPTNDVLRQIAVHYLHKPDPQVPVIHTEPGQTHGVRVVITLELAGL